MSNKDEQIQPFQTRSSQIVMNSLAQVAQHPIRRRSTVIHREQVQLILLVLHHMVPAVLEQAAQVQQAQARLLQQQQPRGQLFISHLKLTQLFRML